LATTLRELPNQDDVRFKEEEMSRPRVEIVRSAR
jgi:hypothetical protein